jgi:hypothetical protein
MDLTMFKQNYGIHLPSLKQCDISSSSCVRIQGPAALMHCGLSWAYCAPLDLVPPVIFRGAPRPTT